MKFGDNLKNIRKYKKISQEELAEKLGVSRQSISKWETGENYPSMTNIMCLCTIFNCKINELVHEDMVDYFSLDNEIKMSVVKFKKNEQKKMKVLSKIIYVISKISKILARVGLVCAIIVSAVLIGAASTMSVDKSNNEVTIFNEKMTYELSTKEFSISDGKDKNVISNKLTNDEVETIDKALDLSKCMKITISVLLSASFIGTMFVTIKLCSYLEKLFKNIHDNDTPFNMDNVLYVRMLALYTLLYLSLSDVLGGIAQGISLLNFNIEIQLENYVVALIILALSYVFKYGYEIQLDSKGKIYGDENE